ncbi:MAG: DUF6746 family protein [Porticoccaceae bacterium]
MKTLPLAGALLVLGLSCTALAEDRPDHFHGKSADTLEAAVANFSEYNEKLAALLAKDDLEPVDMAQVHELTYTLENALEKISEELDELADTLEEVHVASEKLDAEVVKTQGQKYLETARKIVQ